MNDEITLRVDLPDVVETPYRIEVRCGDTTCDVYEYGRRGSGSWAVWKSEGGHTVGTNDYNYEQALVIARKYVRDAGRSRLMHEQLRRVLNEAVTSDE